MWRRLCVLLAGLLLLLAAACRSPEVVQPAKSGPPEPGKVRVTWFGQSMFLVQDGATSLVTDPYGPDIGYILPRVSADVVLVSSAARKQETTSIKGKSRVIETIGESYVGSFVVLGIPSFRDSRARRPNRIYYWKMAGVSFAHMGDFGQRALSAQQEGLLRGVDVLMMPVGGGTTADARAAARITKAINPRVVIPMDYKTPAVVVDLAPVETFSGRFASIKRIGDSFEASRDELPEQTEVWVMKYRQQRS